MSQVSFSIMCALWSCCYIADSIKVALGINGNWALGSYYINLVVTQANHQILLYAQIPNAQSLMTNIVKATSIELGVSKIQSILAALARQSWFLKINRNLVSKHSFRYTFNLSNNQWVWATAILSYHALSLSSILCFTEVSRDIVVKTHVIGLPVLCVPFIFSAGPNVAVRSCMVT